MSESPNTVSGNVTVLVVDDQAPFRAAARAVVDRLAGFEIVAEAESGESAIEMVDALHPQVILMDINMGGIDGIEATTRIAGKHPQTMIVLLSTYELGDLPPSARTSGASAYVNKDEFGGRILRTLWENAGDPTFRPG
ncbi:MAG: response regulator receiver protein [Acidimicrobiales bacterium]|nr:response regulator receiver protein [Acidimicrobiales bacterium]